MIITTSWDDGYPADLRIAEMLSKRGLCGTLKLTRFGGHLTIGDAGPQEGCPHAQIETALPAGVPS